MPIVPSLMKFQISIHYGTADDLAVRGRVLTVNLAAIEADFFLLPIS